MLEAMQSQLVTMANALEQAVAGNIDAFNMMQRALKEVMQQGEQAELDLKKTRRAAIRRRQSK